MSKHSKSNNPPSNSSSCFTTILQRLICTGNLPTNPTPPDHRILVKPDSLTNKNVNGSDIIAVQAQVQAQVRENSSNGGPGIVARLMGLDTLPGKYHKNNDVTTLDSLFRSKSLNSVHFLPDFDPTRAAFHRRARTTSASFHEQGRSHSNFFFVSNGDSKLDSDDTKKKKKKKKAADFKATVTKECNKKSRPPPRDGGQVIKDSRSNKKRYEECYTSSTSCSSGSMRLRNNNNDDDGGLREKCGVQKRKLLVSTKKGKLSGKVVDSSMIHSRKKMVDHNKQDMICIEVQSDDQLLSRSPVSVLDGHLTKEISPFSKGEGRKLSSNSRRKSSPKIKINDNLPQDIPPKSTKNYQDYCNKIANKQELVKAEVEAAENFMEMLENICKLAGEEHIKKDTKWVKKYELLKVHFVEDLCIHLGQDLVDLLLDELLDEIGMAL